MSDTIHRATGPSRRALAGLMTGAAALALLPDAARAQNGGSANLAMVGEPQSLDPMASTADLVGTIMMHVYESLFTFDADLNARPMLAAEMPKLSADGTVYEIAIRPDVKLHNGRSLDADDVVASLKRWLEMTPRGKSIAADVERLEAKAPLGIEITLKKPVPALLTHLEETARATGVPLLCLETGTNQQAALRFYEREGFRRCAVFGDYAAMLPQAIATSIFMRKPLGPG